MRCAALRAAPDVLRGAEIDPAPDVPARRFTTVPAPRMEDARREGLASPDARLAAEAGLFFGPTAGAASLPAIPPSQTPAALQTAPRAGPAAAAVDGLRLRAGSILAAALLVDLDTGRNGPVTAVLTRDARDSLTGRHVLAPQGARLLGRYDGGSGHGEGRAYVRWSRLLLPDGRDVPLDDEPGVDAAGRLGAQGAVERRLGAVALSILSGGALSALGQAARRADARPTGFVDAAGEAAALQGAALAEKLMERELEVRPVVRLPAGTEMGVLLTRDLVIPPFGQVHAATSPQSVGRPETAGSEPVRR